MTEEEAMRRAIEIAGSAVALGRQLDGITSQAVSQWKRVPADRVLEVERITGVSRHDMRPDIFGPAPSTLLIRIDGLLRDREWIAVRLTQLEEEAAQERERSAAALTEIDAQLVLLKERDETLRTKLDALADLAGAEKEPTNQPTKEAADNGASA